MEPLTLPLISFLPELRRADSRPPSTGEPLGNALPVLGEHSAGDARGDRRQGNCPMPPSLAHRHSRSNGQVEFDEGASTEASASRQLYPHDRQYSYQQQLQSSCQQRPEHRMPSPRDNLSVRQSPASVPLQSMESVTEPAEGRTQLAQTSHRQYPQQPLERCAAFHPQAQDRLQPMRHTQEDDNPPLMHRNFQPHSYAWSRLSEAKSPSLVVEKRRRNLHRRSTSAPFQLAEDDTRKVPSGPSATCTTSGPPVLLFPPSPSWEADVSYYRRSSAGSLANTTATGARSTSRAGWSSCSTGGGNAGCTANTPFPVTSACMHLPTGNDHRRATMAAGITRSSCPSMPLPGRSERHSTAPPLTTSASDTTTHSTCASCPSIPFPVSGKSPRSSTAPAPAVLTRQLTPPFDPQSFCLTLRAISLPPLGPERPLSRPPLSPVRSATLPSPCTASPLALPPLSHERSLALPPLCPVRSATLPLPCTETPASLPLLSPERRASAPPLSPEKSAALPPLSPVRSATLPSPWTKGAASYQQAQQRWPSRSPPAAATVGGGRHVTGGRVFSGSPVGGGGEGRRAFAVSPPFRHRRTASTGQLRPQPIELLPAAGYQFFSAMSRSQAGGLAGMTVGHVAVDGSSDEYDLE